VATWQQNIVRGRYKETFLTTVEGIEDKKKEITATIDRALYNFIREYKLEVKGAVPEWIRQEDWIKGEEYIDNLPRETIIYDSVFKKVYPTGVEFVSGKGAETTGNIKNYIKNRSLEDFTPLIAEEISLVNQRLGAFEERALNPLTKQIELHLEVQRETLKTLKKIQQSLGKENKYFIDELLSSQEKADWFNHLSKKEQDEVLGL
jgi:hypothetical protein